MFDIFLEHSFLTGVILLLLLLSIICQIIIGVTYQNMIKESDNMSATDNKLLKQCKLKFCNCYQLNGGVPNVPVYVDKFLNKVKVMGITLTGYRHLSGQFMLLSVFAAGLGSCQAIVAGETLGRILPYYLLCFLELYLYFSISSLVDIQGKRSVLKTSLIDYLENHMAGRLKQTDKDLQITLGDTATAMVNAAAARREKAYAMKNKNNNVSAKEESSLLKGTGAAAETVGVAEGNVQAYPGEIIFTEKEEKELEMLLQEFFA